MKTFMNTYIVRLLKKRRIKGTTSRPMLASLLAAGSHEFQESINVHEEGMPLRSRLPIIGLKRSEGEAILRSRGDDTQDKKCIVDGTYTLFEDYLVSVRKESDIRYDSKTKVLYVCGYPIPDVINFGTLDEHNCFNIHYYSEELKTSDTLTLDFFKRRDDKDAVIFVSNSVYNSKRAEVIFIHDGQLQLPEEVTYPTVFKNKRVTDKWLVSLPTASAFSKLSDLRQQALADEDKDDEDPWGYLTRDDLRKKLVSMDRLEIEQHISKFFELDDEDDEDIVECDDAELIEKVIDIYHGDPSDEDDTDEDEEESPEFDFGDQSDYKHRDLEPVLVENLRLSLAYHGVHRGYLLHTSVNTLVKAAITVICDTDDDDDDDSLGDAPDTSLQTDTYRQQDLDPVLVEELRLALASQGIDRHRLLGASAGTLISLASTAIDNN